MKALFPAAVSAILQPMLTSTRYCGRPCRTAVGARQKRSIIAGGLEQQLLDLAESRFRVRQLSQEFSVCEFESKVVVAQVANQFHLSSNLVALLAVHRMAPIGDRRRGAASHESRHGSGNLHPSCDMRIAGGGSSGRASGRCGSGVDDYVIDCRLVIIDCNLVNTGADAGRTTYDFQVQLR